MFKNTLYGSLIYILLICNAAFAGYEDGAKAAKNGDFVTALREFMPLAEQGDALAQVRVGGLYLNGAGVDKNKDIAFSWFLKSANQGNTDAQIMLASDYYKQKKYNLSAEWYAKLVEKGMPDAMFYLGLIYIVGPAGVPKDLEKAASLMKLSAENGYDDAKLELGMLYFQGDGVEKDIEKATYWFKKSADSGSKDGKEMFDYVTRAGKSSEDSSLIKLQCNVISIVTADSKMYKEEKGVALIEISDNGTNKHIFINSALESLNNINVATKVISGYRSTDNSVKNKWDITTTKEKSSGNQAGYSHHVIIDRNSGNVIATRSFSNFLISSSGNCEKINTSVKKF